MDAYEQHRADMRTGDILLFSGNGLISKGIQALTNSPWSHVAVVFDAGFDFICCFESTTLSDLPDLLTGKPVKGVQMVPLSQRLSTYDGDLIGWRRVEAPRDDHATTAALKARDEFTGVPYEENRLELLRSALDRLTFKENQPDTSSLFCSELIAILWMRMGWLKDGFPANEYTPADFAGDGLPVENGVTVGPITMLKGDVGNTAELEEVNED